MTGASVGLGRSMSLALAKAGARVVLAAPETDLLETVAAEIDAKAGPGRAFPLKTDITIRSDCERLLPRASAGSAGCTSWSTTRAVPCAVRGFRRRAISCRSGSSIRTSGGSW